MKQRGVKINAERGTPGQRAPKAGTSVAPALDRGLTILESLAQTSSSLSQTEIAREVGLTVSEIQRVVLVLHQRGYLVRDAVGHYRLSSKLLRLATQYPPLRDLAARALPAMQQFADETTESVHLAVLRDDRLVIVQNVEGRGLVRLSLQMGSAQDPATTVSGRTLLAWLDPVEVEAFAKRTRIPARSLNKLRRRLRAVKLQGFEHSKSELLEGLEDLGVPIVLPGETAVAALTTSYLLPRGGGQKLGPLVQHLKRAAERIAREYA